MNSGEFPPIESLLPHRGDSLLIKGVIGHDGGSTTTTVVVGDQRWLKRPDGTVAAWLAVEYMAQGIAAHEGLLAHFEGRSLPLGFLASVRNLEIQREQFGPDEKLIVRARRLRGRPGLGALAHHCTIHAEDDTGDHVLVAEGRFAVSVPRPVSPSDPASR